MLARRNDGERACTKGRGKGLQGHVQRARRRSGGPGPGAPAYPSAPGLRAVLLFRGIRPAGPCRDARTLLRRHRPGRLHHSRRDHSGGLRARLRQRGGLRRAQLRHQQRADRRNGALQPAGRAADGRDPGGRLSPRRPGADQGPQFRPDLARRPVQPRRGGARRAWRGARRDPAFRWLGRRRPAPDPHPCLPPGPVPYRGGSGGAGQHLAGLRGLHHPSRGAARRKSWW